MTTATAPTPLTDRQREIYSYIWDRTCEDGYQPSFRDIMARFGITSPNGIAVHLRALARKGWVGQADVARTRSIRFLRTPDGREFRGFRPIED